MPSGDNIALLRQHALLPLATLFTVDQKSPYSHEENKASIFYAESWVLTHYILINDYRDKTHRLTDYAELLTQNVPPVEAATRAFGDLHQLETALERYVQQANFYGFKTAASTQVDDSAFKVQPLAAVQAGALQADFLAYNERTADARSLFDRILHEHPNNVSAHETMGLLEFRQGHWDEAKKWYALAVQLDSQSYLAHYYYAAMLVNDPQPSSHDKVESSLRRAIKLNPSFAPAFDSLAVFLGTRHRNLEEAHLMGVTAVSLDPGNIRFRINEANVLMMMGQGPNAINVLRDAAKLAKTPQDVQTIDNFLTNAQEYVAAQEGRAQQPAIPEDARARVQASGSETASDAGTPTLVRRDTFVAKRPHQFLAGVLKSVDCDAPKMDLTVESGGKSLALHSENYYKIQFTALNRSSSRNGRETT